MPPGGMESDRGLEAFQDAPTRRLEVEAARARSLHYLGGHEDLARHGQLGDARRQVDDRAVVVAAAEQDRAARESTARCDRGVVGEALDQRERDVAGGSGVDGDE